MSADVVPDLVSVIVPVFNRKEMLLDAVAAVEGQTYRPIELILVDDGSTDGTGALCDRLAAEKPDLVRALHRENGGPGAARETGRLAALGEFLQYLDSDDWIAPEKLERQVRALRAEPAAGLCVCPTWEHELGSRPSGGPSLKTGARPSKVFPGLLLGRLWQTVTPLWRRTLTDAIGPWEPLRQEEDREYDARAGALGVEVAFVPEFLAAYRHHGQTRLGASWTRSVERFRERIRALELLLTHARRSGCVPGDPEVARFARELFLVARQAGAAGLEAESKRLYGVAREAAGGPRGEPLDLRIYGAVARVVGWRVTGRMACWTDRFRQASRISS